MKVYQDAYNGAVAMQKTADADVAACEAKDKAAALALDAAKTKQAAAVANCKGV